MPVGQLLQVRGQYLVNPQANGVPGHTHEPPPPQSFANYPIVQQIWDRGFSAQLDWNIGAAELTSIRAWGGNSIDAGNDRPSRRRSRASLSGALTIRSIRSRATRAPLAPPYE